MAGAAWFAVLGVVVLVLGCAACGGAGRPSGPGPEKTSITVGIVPVPDSASVVYAQRHGFFAAAGIRKVRIKTIPTTIAANPQLLAGTMDVALGNYPTVFTAAAHSPGTWKIIADAYRAAPHAFVVVPAPGSKITQPSQLKGATIAVPALGSIGTLAVLASLKPYGIGPGQVKFVPMPFSQMTEALRTGQVQAAWLTEPYITTVGEKLGAGSVLDTMAGPTDGMPISGWEATAAWTRKYPKTLAAFRTAVGRAQRALARRSAVEQTLPAYTPISATTAAVISLGDYPLDLDTVNLQRVDGLMVEFGALHAPVDVQRLLAPAA